MKSAVYTSHVPGETETGRPLRLGDVCEVDETAPHIKALVERGALLWSTEKTAKLKTKQDDSGGETR